MKKKNKNKVFPSILLILALSLVTFKILDKKNFFNNLSIGSGETSYNAKAKEGGKSGTNTSAQKSDKDDKTKVQFIELNDMEKKIEDYLGSERINSIGLVYYDINSEQFIKINSDKEFKAASTTKVPINMCLMDMVNKGQISLEDTVKYNERLDYEDGALKLTLDELKKPIKLKKLSDYSIIYSDNIATQMIKRGIKNAHYDFIEKIIGHPMDKTNNITTAMDSFKILKRLYDNPDSNTYYKSLIETMKKTDYHDRIDKYIPRDKVAHKIGDFEDYVNDIAIVYADNPYILTIFTDGMPNACEVIANVSKIIYNEHNKIDRN